MAPLRTPVPAAVLVTCERLPQHRDEWSIAGQEHGSGLAESVAWSRRSSRRASCLPLARRSRRRWPSHPTGALDDSSTVSEVTCRFLRRRVPGDCLDRVPRVERPRRLDDGGRRLVGRPSPCVGVDHGAVWHPVTRLRWPRRSSTGATFFSRGGRDTIKWLRRSPPCVAGPLRFAWPRALARLPARCGSRDESS